MAGPEACTKREKLSPKPSTRELLLQASVTVLSVTLVMILVTWSGVFDSATVELGLEHYAEKHLSWLPDYIPMPLNTAINFGYVLCACYWCFIIQREYNSGAVNDADAYFFFVFNVMSYLCGFVQLYRIVFQTLRSAIMDQWYTLPFFMMVYVWVQNVRGKCSWFQFYALMCASLVSYSLTLLTPVGFELSLGCHIVLSVSVGCSLYWEDPSDYALRCVFLGIFSCCGFVVLKLMDLYLPHVHWIFSYVSGHFLSKICDVFQIHTTNNFFFNFARKSPRNMLGKEE